MFGGRVLRNFKDLKVWQEGPGLTLEVYKDLKGFPRDEQFGLISQMRKSSASIPTNIAEGCGRRTNADFVQFLHIPLGSANELEYQLLLSKDLGYLAEDKHQLLEQKINQNQTNANCFYPKAPALSLCFCLYLIPYTFYF